MVVEGPAGIGKTSLLPAARTVAAESGMRVLRSRATEVEREFPFGIVRQLFEPTLIEASKSERAELLEGAAGIAAGLLGLGGSRASFANFSSTPETAYPPCWGTTFSFPGKPFASATQAGRE